MEGNVMKRFGNLVLAAVLGSALTIGTYSFFESDSGNSFKIEHISETPVVGAAYTVNKKGEIMPLEFTDAAINPGNSGGALVNLQGGLVGINTAIASPTGAYAGYGFAVPASIVSKVVSDLQKYGMVQRGYLGLMIRSVDGNLAKEKELEITKGVYVDSITAKSAAGDAGIEVGDVILKVDDIGVSTSAELLEVIGRHHPGDKLTLNINRKGKEMDILVTLRNQEGKEDMSERMESEILEVLGVELKEIDKKTAEKLLNKAEKWAKDNGANSIIKEYLLLQKD